MNRRFLAASLLLWSCSRPGQTAPEIREEQVRFRNGDITLAGNLYLPPGRIHPAVVLFHGSGIERRNEFMGRWFAQQGIAALTYDKRGVGESSGDFRTVPFLELANDGLSGIEFLKSRSDIDPKRIGVWGLSQGGWLGPLAASRSKDVAFVIAVSGPGVTPGEQMIFYYANQLRDEGVAEPQIREASDLRRKVWRYLSTGEGYDEARAALNRGQSLPWFKALQDQSDGLFQISPAAKILTDPAIRHRIWFSTEMNYDPTVALRKLSVPALFLFGESDKLVPVPASVDIIRRTLTEAGRQDFTIKTFPGADHTIRESTADGGRQIVPDYLETTRSWVRRIAGLR